MAEAKKSVNRATVFEVCSASLDAGIIPKLKDFRSQFDAPFSPKLAVYYGEWKEENADNLNHSGGYWKARAEERQLEIDRLNEEVQKLQSQITILESHLHPSEPHHG